MYNRCDNCIYCYLTSHWTIVFFFFSTFSSSKKFRFSWVWLDAFKAYGLHKDPQCVLAFLGLELEVNFVVRKFNGFIACQNISKEMDTKKS